MNAIRKHAFVIFIVFLSIIATSSLTIAAYFLLAMPNLWTEASSPTMGQRGDFFGGFLNPILTTLTFAAFLTTVLMQRAELKNSRQQLEASVNEMRRQTANARAQNYQTSFFSY
ncbi:hypothetical protein [Methylorubrum extorquens]|uniref:Uncharacterized protein n=1 Tax=Methylorubrum extorquens TaxID=408 RepID=A0AAX3WDZ3_METEX|nr:hypothetical protein [Methylorubrum extorquens]WHQ69676.1 hypothetical protein KEC54_25700 [Methylorubrum extorquens]